MKDAQDLQVFLRAKAQAVKPTAAVDWERTKRQWLDNIANLYRQVEAWLEPLIEEGVVRIEKGRTDLEEELIGVYEVEIFRILIGNQEVGFHPKGRLIIGAQGRIDIMGQRAARSIIFNDDQWFVVERTPRIKMLPFNEHSFQDVLSEVME